MDENIFIIGGTEKAGTTSLFEYLALHPEVTTSKRKETDYFRKFNSFDSYIEQFNEKKNNHKVYVEASPGYLGKSKRVIENIDESSTRAKIKVLFILRDPIERLISSFMFHKSKFYIPEKINIDEYIRMCLDYTDEKISILDTPFENPWFLEVLYAAKYKTHLEIYFSSKNIEVKVIDFTEISENIDSVMEELCDWISINPDFYHGFEYFRSNKTMQSKNKTLHKIGMFLNNRTERFLRKNPIIKRKLVSIYQKINGQKNEEVFISKDSLELLKKYYEEDYLFISEKLSSAGKVCQWKNFKK